MSRPLEQPRSLRDILSDAVRQLSRYQNTAQMDAELLLAHAMKVTRTYLHTWPEHPVEPETLEQYRGLISRRSEGIPVAYLIGSREFWSMELQVTKDTLIPRPETELLVEQALEIIPPEANWTITDLGTGSGAIALAIARERPACHVVATDQSRLPLLVARENARHLQISNISFLTGNWLAPLASRSLHMVVTNPPYIASGDVHLQQEDIRHEPGSALVAGPDGLNAIRQIINATSECMVDGGWLLLEHGYDQGNSVTDLLDEAGFTNIQGYTDLSGHARVASAKVE